MCLFVIGHLNRAFGKLNYFSEKNRENREKEPGDAFLRMRARKRRGLGKATPLHVG